jgi:16S rRNA processing protein RimM
MPAHGLPTAPQDHEPPWPQDAVEVGFVVDAWGVKGWFKVAAYAAQPEALFSSRRWFLQPPAAPGAGPRPTDDALPRLLKITQIKEHGDAIVAAAQDIADRGQAERLRGVRIFVSRASFPTAAVDEYYWVDLIGATVVNLQGVTLGRVHDLIDTGVHSVLRLDTGGARPAWRLIPFVGAYIHRVDVAGKRIEVDWDPAWDEDEAGTRPED